MANATTTGTTELPAYGALLLLTTLARVEGLGPYSKSPREFVAPGGDRWIVSLRDEEGGRMVEITREPSAYDVDGARNRLARARNELASSMRTARLCDATLASEATDPAIVAHAESVRNDARAAARRWQVEVKALEPQAIAPEAQTWRFAPRLNGFSFRVEGA